MNALAQSKEHTVGIVFPGHASPVQQMADTAVARSAKSGIGQAPWPMKVVNETGKKPRSTAWLRRCPVQEAQHPDEEEGSRRLATVLSSHLQIW